MDLLAYLDLVKACVAEAQAKGDRAELIRLLRALQDTLQTSIEQLCAGGQDR
jgi:alpha-D-ribose 1-methylphosphonate 5-triphosphate synthase subunit PhnI